MVESKSEAIGMAPEVPQRKYTYNPANLQEEGVDRMRFELGDTTFAPGELTAALCDEEYFAMISAYPTWQKAKIACLRAILAKYSHQVDMNVNGLSYSFSDRIPVWKAMLKGAESSLSGAVPVSSGDLGEHYFHNDMLSNPRKG